MIRHTSFDLQRNVRLVQEDAAKGGVIITHRGKDRLVMTTVEDYKKRGSGRLSHVLRTLQAHRHELEREGIDEIHIFGSVARAEDTFESDVDLLVVPQEHVSVGGLKLSHWKNILSEMLSCDADVVVREYLDPKVWETARKDLICAFQGRTFHVAAE